MQQKFRNLSTLAVLLMLPFQSLWAMHISEGFLPVGDCIFWYALSIPFIALGIRSVRKMLEQNPREKVLLGVSGAFVFVLSALKLPSVTGSCSHLTGTGLGTMLMGPWVMALLALVVLLFQALLLAHGGLTTLGANLFSMGIAGPLLTWLIFWSGNKLKWNRKVTVFAASFTGSLFTYLVTSIQLAVAFPDASGGWQASLIKFGTLFGLTQLPLAIIEGILTLWIFTVVEGYRKEEVPKEQSAKVPEYQS